MPSSIPANLPRDAIRSLLQPRLFFVTLLAASLTFEDFVLKWLPISDLAYSISRFISEGLIYSLFIYVLGCRFLGAGRPRYTRIDWGVLCFLAAALLSIYVNDAPVLGSLVNLRVLVRYVLLFYVVVNLDLNPREVQSFLLLIIVIGVVQSLIGLIQAMQGGPTEFWLPRQSDFEVAGYSKRFTVLTGGVEKGAVLGAFGYPVAMALYLLIAAICTLSLLLEMQNRTLFKQFLAYCALIIFLGGILLTYSRAAFAATALAIPVVLWIGRRVRTLLGMVAVTLVALSVLIGGTAVIGGPNDIGYVKDREQYVNPLYNLRLLFSNDYWERTEGSRQWMIKEVGSSLVEQGSLLGFSPDETTAKNEIVARSKGALRKLITYRAFEDVYWIAMLAYYGLIGLGLYLYILLILYRCAAAGARAGLASSRVVSMAFATLLVVSVPLTLIVQTFEFRTFGFYFWLLAALMYTEYERHRHARPAVMGASRRADDDLTAKLYLAHDGARNDRRN